MEVGKPGDLNVATGWLGRHLASRPPMKADAALRGVGFSFGMPLTLAGAPATLPIPDPANFGLSGSSSSASAAPRLAGKRLPVRAGSAQDGRAQHAAHDRALTGLNIAGYVPAGGAVYPGGSFGAALRSTAALIRADIGVEAVQIDIGGWDTHSAQGPLTGGMATTMGQLAQALAAFHADMKAPAASNKVTLVAISEFGRVARENGSQGTDHGHGNVMFVMGGAISGGRVMANWPGLAPGSSTRTRTCRSRSTTATSWPRSCSGASATPTSIWCSRGSRRRSGAYLCKGPTGSGFRVQRFKVQGSGFRVQGSQVQGSSVR